MALAATGFFEIELGVGVGEKFFDALATVVDGDADTGGEMGRFGIPGHDGVDAISNARGFFVERFRQNEGEFVADIARGGVDGVRCRTGGS